MMHYGGSLTTSYPNTIFTNPVSIQSPPPPTPTQQQQQQQQQSIQTCQFCGLKSGSKINCSNVNSKLKYSLMLKIEKCKHCGLNICDQCLNEINKDYDNGCKSDDELVDAEFDFKLNLYQKHYKVVKKEFKANYNRVKEIVEKFNYLQNSIKLDEITLSELNLVKHQINVKANELIRKIEQEKIELNERIDNVRQRYETLLNEKKQYFGFSLEVKEELKKLIKKYKENRPVDSNFSLKELLDMYSIAKSLNENVENYSKVDNLIGHEPLEFNFEERPNYRNHIGQLYINDNKNINENSFTSIQQRQVPQTQQQQQLQQVPQNDIQLNTIQNSVRLKKLLKAKLDIPRSNSMDNLLTHNSQQLFLTEKNPLKHQIKSDTDLPIKNSIKPSIDHDVIKRSIEYKRKQGPIQRLDIDVLPSYLHYAKNKLLVASSQAKIRIFDLITNRIQKDEIKNILINSVSMPLNVKTDRENELVFALTNGELNEEQDDLNVSNSVIVVTKKELKVLKKQSTSINDDYHFSNPCGVCFDEYNNLYVCDTGFNRIKILDSNLVLKCIIETASNENDFLNQPKSICTCVTKSLLYVCDSGNHRIVCYSILNQGNSYQFKQSFGLGYGEDFGQMRFPHDISIDNLGFLSIRDHHNSRILIFSPDGIPIHSLEINSQFETIYSLTSSEKGELFVAKMAYTREIEPSTGQFLNICKYFIDIY